MNILWFLSFRANHSCPFATFLANTSALFLVVPRLSSNWSTCWTVGTSHWDCWDPRIQLGSVALDGDDGRPQTILEDRVLRQLRDCIHHQCTIHDLWCQGQGHHGDSEEHTEWGSKMVNEWWQQSWWPEILMIYGFNLSAAHPSWWSQYSWSFTSGNSVGDPSNPVCFEVQGVINWISGFNSRWDTEKEQFNSSLWKRPKKWLINYTVAFTR